MQTIGKAAFIGQAGGENVACKKTVGKRFFPFPTHRKAVERIAQFLFVRIPEHPVGMAEGGRDGMVPPCTESAGPNRVGRPVFHEEGSGKAVGRCQRPDSQDASHRVPPVQGSLRPPQQGHAADRLPVEIIGILIQDGNPVQIQAQHRILHPRTQSAQVNGRCQRRPVIRNMQTRHHSGQRIRTIRSGCPHQFRADGGNRRRHLGKGDGFL